MSKPEKIFVFGAGGHAKGVIDAIERERRHVIAWVCDDAAEKHGTQVMRYEIVGGRDDLLARKVEKRCGRHSYRRQWRPNEDRIVAR